jgi:hypothetical protein
MSASLSLDKSDKLECLCASQRRVRHMHKRSNIQILLHFSLSALLAHDVPNAYILHHLYISPLYLLTLLYENNWVSQKRSIAVKFQTERMFSQPNAHTPTRHAKKQSAQEGPQRGFQRQNVSTTPMVVKVLGYVQGREIRNDKK